MPVGDVVKTKGNRLITVTEQARVRDAAKLMESRRIGALIVLTSEGKLKGILSERDVVSAFARCGLTYHFAQEQEGWQLVFIDVRRPDCSPEPIFTDYKRPRDAKDDLIAQAVDVARYAKQARNSELPQFNIGKAAT